MRGVTTLMVFLITLLAALGCEATATLNPPADRPAATVRIGGMADYAVDVAVRPEERRQGLSGRPYMPPDAGMLFMFNDEQVRHFWMKEMHFPLDIIWIDAQCQLIGWAADVPTPPPDGGDAAIPRVQSPSPARYVLELNAGEAARAGLSPGDQVEFLGNIAGQYGC